MSKRVVLVMNEGTLQRAFSDTEDIEIVVVNFDELETEQEREDEQKRINTLAKDAFSVSIDYIDKYRN